MISTVAKTGRIRRVGQTALSGDELRAVLKPAAKFCPLGPMAGHSLTEMRDSGPSDPQLLAAWLQHQREPAFHELVARYAGLVQATARRICGDESLAAEASQLTFITLARKAKSLTSCASLGGWLHRTAILHARNQLRQNRRESRKRQHLAMEPEPSPQPGDAWQEMQPVLDDALAALSEKDREALLLRFYRSLSVREVAATLGIATDAAQKRIDRATERLRGKLARRGCQAGGSLGGMMLAGFAADTQAATLSVSAITSKALAAGATGSSGLATTFTHLTTAAMKTTSSIPSLVALAIAGVWIANQRQSIASIERQNGLLQSQLDGGVTRTSTPPKRTAPITTVLDRKPIDWYEVARQLDTKEGGGGYFRPNLRLEEGLLSMTRDQLISALDEIAVFDLPENYRFRLERMLNEPLVKKDPEYALKRYFNRFYVPGSAQVDSTFTYALNLWALKDPANAEAWFDKQIAAGKIDSRSVKPNFYGRVWWEGALTSALLAVDPDGANRRLAGLPQAERINVLSCDSFGPVWKKPEISLAYANLLRQQLPENDHLNAISWPVRRLGEGGTIQFSAVHDYMQRIQATPAERESCILGMTGRFPRASDEFGKVAKEDLDALFEWVRTEAPDLVGQSISGAFAGLVQNIGYSAAAELALQCHEASGEDEVLLPLLNNYDAQENKDLARTLATRLTDTKQREEFLEKFK